MTLFPTEVGVRAWSRLADQLWLCEHCLVRQKHRPWKSCGSGLEEKLQNQWAVARLVEEDMGRKSGCRRLLLLPRTALHSFALLPGGSSGVSCSCGSRFQPSPDVFMPGLAYFLRIILDASVHFLVVFVSV